MSDIERQVRMGDKLLGVPIWTPLNKEHPYSLCAPAYTLFEINGKPSVEFLDWDYALIALQTLRPNKLFMAIAGHLQDVKNNLTKANP